MTLQQEAYRRIDEMTDDGIRILIDMIDKMRTVSAIGFKDKTDDIDAMLESISLTKEEKKSRFMESAGKIRIDAEAVNDLRRRSMI